MTTQLQCAECNAMFEVSSPTAEAMHRWRAQSGEPFICGKCAGVDKIISIETDNPNRKGSGRTAPYKTNIIVASETVTSNQ